MDVDWSRIDDVCHTHSVALEAHDGKVRPAFDAVGEVVHADNCWLGKNYLLQPEARQRGCDMGCIKEAARKRGEQL